MPPRRVATASVGLVLTVGLVTTGRHVTVNDIHIHPLRRGLGEGNPGGKPLWVRCTHVPLDLLLNILKRC